MRLTHDEAEAVQRSRSHNATLKQKPGNRSQNATGSQKHRDPRFLPYAFTEHGAIQAANVLNSDTAVEMSVQLEGHDAAIHNLFEAIRQLLNPPEPPKREIGFHVKDGRGRYVLSALKHHPV